MKNIHAQWSQQVAEICLQEWQESAFHRVLQEGVKRVEDLFFLLSIPPQRSDLMKKMVRKSHALTIKRFGYARVLYIPLYLSNFCHNACTYCGLSIKNRVQRKTLSQREIVKELEELKGRGYRHLLLVSGEWDHFTNRDYLQKAVATAHQRGFSAIDVELGALDQLTATMLSDAGASGYLLYQETYHRPTYKKVHPWGQKSLMDYRLEGFDRAYLAGFREMGLGILLGLYDFRYDLMMLFLHLQALRKRYFDVQWKLSLPRFNSATGVSSIRYPVTDKETLLAFLALRQAFPEIPISLSTREDPSLRDFLVQGVATHISVESQTSPGGYAQKNHHLEQFSIKDRRPLSEMKKHFQSLSLDPVLKDGDSSLHTRSFCQ